MDWNWFFSALAQSTAAIVGIFAAFIITKIINNQGVLDQKGRDAKRQLADCLALERRAKDHSFKWYNDRIRELEFRGLTERLLASTSSGGMPAARKKLEGLHKGLEFSLYDDLLYIQRTIDELGIALEGGEWEDVDRVLGEMIYGPARASKSEHRPTATAVPGTVLIETKKQELDSLRREIGNHIRRAEDFIDDNSDNPESSSLVTWAIQVVIFLFYGGVICPLLLLPLDDTQPSLLSLVAFCNPFFWIKMALLILISAIVTIIMIRFMNINIGLKLNEEDMKKLEEYTHYLTYDEHLANYEKNTA